MNTELIVGRVLDDEGLIGDLDESEAQQLIEWAVKQAEQIASAAASEKQALARVEKLCGQGRAIARLVTLFCHDDQKGAERLAKAENLPWPIAAKPTASAALQWLLEKSQAPA